MLSIVALCVSITTTFTSAIHLINLLLVIFVNKIAFHSVYFIFFVIIFITIIKFIIIIIIVVVISFFPTSTTGKVT